MTDDRHTCPRRSETGPWAQTPGVDKWENRPHGRIGQEEIGSSCSFCGSLNPERFMDLLRQGWFLGPTDRSYKAYISHAATGRSGKFYFQHLSADQQRDFITLYNAGLNVGYPGHLYVMPYFAKARERERPIGESEH